MSVDSKRENFHMNWVGVDKLSDFLTAQTYRPEITEALVKIKSFGKWSHLHEMCAEPIRQGVSPAYAEEGYPCLKSKHTNNLIVDRTDYDFVTEEFAQSKSHLKVKNEDILITRSGAGTIGRASIFFGDDTPLTNEHLFKVRTVNVDSGFVSAFLRSYFGERILEYGISGSTGQLNLSNTHIKWLPVIQPRELTQTYIGNKVRQAELLRELANEFFVKLRKEMLLVLTTNSPNTIGELVKNNHQKTVRISSKEIGGRLDAWFYKPEFTKAAKVFDEIKKSGIKLSKVGEIGTVEYGFMPLEDYWSETKGHPFLRVTNIKDQLTISDDEIKHINPVSSNAPKFLLKEDDIVVVQLGNSTGRVGYISARYENWAFPSFALRVRVNSPKFDPAFVAVFLSENLGQNQLNRTVSITSVRPNTTKPAVESILIPELDFKTQQSIGNLLRLATAAFENATSLTRSSIELVESLIEGQITEAQLIEAQQALEEGDNSKDRVILSKLTDKGYLADNGKPLFTDLDKLYELLDEAKVAMGVDGELV
jgi:type I restriction enzyme S subunit